MKVTGPETIPTEIKDNRNGTYTIVLKKPLILVFTESIEQLVLFVFN